ncbi:MAG: hypothetical protein RH917_15390 [Lacipirellulaceae bacterium]
MRSAVSATSIGIHSANTIRKARPAVDDLNDLDDYAWLIGDEAKKYLRELAQDTRPTLERLTSLRKKLSSARARLVVQQSELRRKAVAKFGELADQLFFTPTQLQQATDHWIARYKAARFGSDDVVDFCCGIGGDLLSLAERGSATGWEHDPRIALIAETNLACVRAKHASCVKVADVAEARVEPGQSWHADPDRRIGNRRSIQIELHSPSKETIQKWLQSASEGAVKLAPASTPPSQWQKSSEQEWISRGRECKQLMLWFGSLSNNHGKRRATSLHLNEEDEPTSISYLGEHADAISIAEMPGKYVYDPDPALIAAKLTGSLANEHGLSSLGPGAIYLTSDKLTAAPLLSAFEVLDTLPLRAKQVSEYLRTRNVGRVEIKVRGVDIRPEQFRKKLALRGDEECSLILTRIGRREVAIVATRV